LIFWNNTYLESLADIMKATGTKTWVVSNGAEIIRDARGIDGIAALTDMYRFANRRR